MMDAGLGQSFADPTRGTSEPSAYFFDRFEVRPAIGQILADGQPISVGPRAFDVLMALIERQDRTVSKHELLDAVWSDASVKEHNLVVQVGHLRRLFGAHAISTIPGRGYRFTATLNKGLDRPTTEQAGGRRARTRELGAAVPEVIGRDTDLVLLHSLLTAHRLVTIVGAGGVGKTRVAKALLAMLRHTYAQGVAWVELTPLTDASQVPGAIARALGVEMANGDPMAGLADALRPSSLLLVLDNAEHLADSIARVAESLLSRTAGVHIMVTSQVPLGLASEQAFRLEPLGLPPTGGSADEALMCGSAALFVRRAESADRRFKLDDSNVAAVVDICRRLDGIPLAVEMAAARVPLLGVNGLAAALNDQLRILISRRRDAPPRQQTLRAMLEWSHQLLSPQEQAVFRRLAVFVGGFSLELALGAVPDTDAEADRWAVLDSLASLVDRSLVMADADDPPRYRLLESTHAFAAQRLADAGEIDPLRERHAHAVHRYFQHVFDERFLEFDVALQRLRKDVDNARAAMNWALENDAQMVIALTAPLALAASESSTDGPHSSEQVSARSTGQIAPCPKRKASHHGDAASVLGTSRDPLRIGRGTLRIADSPGASRPFVL